MILSIKRSPSCHGLVVGLDTRILPFPKFWGSFVFRNYKRVSKQVSRTVPSYKHTYTYTYTYAYTYMYTRIHVQQSYTCRSRVQSIRGSVHMHMCLCPISVYHAMWVLPALHLARPRRPGANAAAAKESTRRPQMHAAFSLYTAFPWFAFGLLSLEPEDSIDAN